MTRARKTIVSLNDTPYYHLIGRCVRRAWLCGFDQHSQRDYAHRRQWVIDRLREIDQIFTINVCAYAIMSNHYHLVLHVDRDRAAALSREEVVERWTRLFTGPPLIQRWRSAQCSAAQRIAAEKIIDDWRLRLFDLSWFMKVLNEHIARKSNDEDGCTGHFWEGRFKSQALLDESAVLAAMVYVDLNPIRAGISHTPEASDFTSIQQRILEHKRAAAPSRADPRSETSSCSQPTSLIPLVPCRDHSGKEALTGRNVRLPINLPDYLKLVDWSGRSIIAGKQGFIDADQPPILARLNLDPNAWATAIDRSKGSITRFGSLSHTTLHAKTLGASWLQQLRRAERSNH